MPDSAGGLDSDRPLHEQLSALQARIGVDLSQEEYQESARQLLERYAAHADGRDHTWVSAFLNVLVRHSCSPVLVTEVARVLTEEIPHRTVKAAANHADVDRRTLERHWKAFCPRRHLRDCMRPPCSCAWPRRTEVGNSVPARPASASKQPERSRGISRSNPCMPWLEVRHRS